MFKRFLSLVLIMSLFLLPVVGVRAEGTVDEIRITSDTTSVTEGALSPFSFQTTTENISIEAYGSNTTWMKWPDGYSGWHGFGTEEPTAVADGTHYAMRLQISLDDGYSFGDDVHIYFNGTDVTGQDYTSLDTGFTWGGYLYIDLGEATASNSGNEVSGSVQKITSANVTIKAPKIGDEVVLEDRQTEYGAYQWPNIEPTVTLESGANYAVDGSMYITAYPSMKPDGYDEFFVGKFEKDTYYYVEVYMYPKEGYEFDDNVVLKVNGSTDNYELSAYNSAVQLMFYARIKATDGSESNATEGSKSSSDKVLKGANQVFSINSKEKLVFRFDIPFNEFKESGKVYIDGKLVDSKNYTISDGSTVVTFNTNYTNTLASGNHTIRVTSTNNDISTSFKVVTNPKTGDNIMCYIVMLVLSGLGAIVLVNKKKVFNN